ncbi:uncharacterized protein V1510DRAFT_401794 [Dipodascopsis tothii]|uniref:uncharacterized protein n=1 Tax=Dipodascopsis tothii TaxID=44089 RepID=UPI0034CF3278
MESETVYVERLLTLERGTVWLNRLMIAQLACAAVILGAVAWDWIRRQAAAPQPSAQRMAELERLVRETREAVLDWRAECELEAEARGRAAAEAEAQAAAQAAAAVAGPSSAPEPTDSGYCSDAYDSDDSLDGALITSDGVVVSLPFDTAFLASAAPVEVSPYDDSELRRRRPLTDDGTELDDLRDRESERSFVFDSLMSIPSESLPEKDLGVNVLVTGVADDEAGTPTSPGLVEGFRRDDVAVH